MCVGAWDGGVVRESLRKVGREAGNDMSLIRREGEQGGNLFGSF